MTISGDRNVIAVGDDTASQEKRKLHTDDIAGAAKPDSEEFSEVEQREGSGADAELQALFAADVERDFRTRWRDIQSGFVDEPRSAVERADALVAQLMQRLAQSFSEQRKNLEKQWEESEKVSTEELRVALTRYRSFFERLLSI